MQVKKITKSGARLTKLTPKQFSLSFIECQSFQKYMAEQGKVAT